MIPYNSKHVKNSVRVAIYIRVSTRDQEAGFGPEMQEHELLKHVERNSYKGWYTSPKWRFFEQESGKNDARPELQRLLKMAAHGEFDVVLVWDISRISRDLLDLLHMFVKLRNRSVGFASLKEDMDFTGHFGKFVLQVLGAIAELEWNKIQERTFEGKLTSARAGNYIYAAPKFGYKRVPNADGKGHKLKLLPDEAETVKQIFHWYVRDKKGLSEIASIFNETNLSKGRYCHPRTRGTKWTDNTIRGILSSEIYRGVFISNKRSLVSRKPKRYRENPENQWIKTQVERVVSDTLFYLANQRLESGNRGARGGGKREYMLAGKLYDPVTRKGFVGYESAKKTKNYRRKKVPASLSLDGQEHKTISLAEKDLAKTVWYYIKMVVNQPHRFIELHRKAGNNSKVKRALESEQLIWESSLNQATDRIDRVQNDFYGGHIDENERNNRRSKLQKDRDLALRKLGEIKQRICQINNYEKACSSVKAFGKNLESRLDLATDQEKKALVQLLVERIEISDHRTPEEFVRKATIFFRFELDSSSSGDGKVRIDSPDYDGSQGGFKSNSDGIGEGERKGYYLFEVYHTLIRKQT